MEKIVVKWKDKHRDPLTVYTDGYIPPDKSHFNYWTLYRDMAKAAWKAGPETVIINSDEVRLVTITEVEENGK